MPEMLMLEIEEKMEKSLSSYSKDLATIRTGKANPNLFDHVMVSYYGVDTPLKQVSSITIPEASQIYIKPFDKSILKLIEVAINAANLGLTPQNDGNGIRIMLPKMTEERRKELVKQVGKYQEGTKVAIRNIRREANDALKKLALTEDEEKSYLESIQKLTDRFIVEVDKVTSIKEKDLMTI